ncbi:MAG: tetratricopeptide repeat family protein [Treponematales bacterium]
MTKNLVSPAALACRSAALAFILFQFRLFAGGLADTAVFAAILASGFLVPLALTLVPRKRPLKTAEALVTLALVPWAARLFVALPRLAAAGEAAVLDALLLNLDRNYFAALVPFYWAAFTTWFALRSAVFLRGDIVASGGLFLLLFAFNSGAALDAYRWPVLMIALFAAALYLQILAFLFSVPKEWKTGRRETAIAALSFLALVTAGGALLVRPSQEKAAQRGGGLLEPKLFRFDFSQILRLDPEISMNDDLVLIVKTDSGRYHTLTRRYTLSGYSAKQGFFRTDADEAAHPQRLPDSRTALPAPAVKTAREIEQEYYLVNFDSGAFIGMNAPAEITPFETWDASSFSAAYGVKSVASKALPFELMDAVTSAGGLTAEAVGMSEADYAFYTEYGGSARVAEYAGRICAGVGGYWDRIEAVFGHLKEGEYRYSLKPGIAPDGDQLSWFLFETKKGYCSYFAYAFTLLLRSLGVPCRAAAGFFIDPESGAFDYYPVRSDMAHAWVEVWFPGYGWIEYDPTTERLAEGEEFRFSFGTPPELFERLMKEILANHSRLREKKGGEDGGGTGLARLRDAAARFLRRGGVPLFLALLAALSLWVRAGRLWLAALARRPRKKTVLLWAHVKRRLALAGTGAAGGAGGLGTEGGTEDAGEADWTREGEARGFRLAALYGLVSAARFAPAFTEADWLAFRREYRFFNESYAAAVPPARRLLSWLLPLIALRLPSGKESRK